MAAYPPRTQRNWFSRCTRAFPVRPAQRPTYELEDPEVALRHRLIDSSRATVPESATRRRPPSGRHRCRREPFAVDPPVPTTREVLGDVGDVRPLDRVPTSCHRWSHVPGGGRRVASPPRISDRGAPKGDAFHPDHGSSSSWGHLHGEPLVPVERDVRPFEVSRLEVAASPPGARRAGGPNSGSGASRPMPSTPLTGTPASRRALRARRCAGSTSGSHTRRGANDRVKNPAGQIHMRFEAHHPPSAILRARTFAPLDEHSRRFPSFWRGSSPASRPVGAARATPPQPIRRSRSPFVVKADLRRLTWLPRTTNVREGNGRACESPAGERFPGFKTDGDTMTSAATRTAPLHPFPPGD